VQALTFNGQQSVTIPAGEDVVSDPLSFTFSAFQDLAVSVYVPSPNNGGLTEHYTARQTSFFAPRSAAGDQAADLEAAPFTVQTTTRPLLAGLDVMASGNVGAVVTLGDSITDGYGGTPAHSGRNPLGASENPIGVNLNGRWPDDLQRRLISAKLPLSVLNAGISGNRILHYGSFDSSPIFAAFGPPALTRLNRDVLEQAGVSDVVVQEGINDIGDLPHASAAEVVAGLTELVNQIHGAGLPVQLGTLTPIEGATYDSPTAEAARTQVNTWIRGQQISDGIIDFDKAVRDPGDPNRLLPAYNSGDSLHPNPAGYQAMADAVDLALLRGPACAAAPPPPLQLTVFPRRVRIGALASFRFTVRATSNGALRAVPGAAVVFNHHRTVSNSRGLALLRLRLTRTGTYRAVATAPGRAPAVSSVYVRR
jgi:lysophospholipase L1-like esterase